MKKKSLPLPLGEGWGEGLQENLLTTAHMFSVLECRKRVEKNILLAFLTLSQRERE